MDLPDPLPPPFSIVHRFRYVFKDTSCIGTDLLYVVIHKAICFDVAQGRMNGAPNETRTHSCRFASLAC